MPNGPSIDETRIRPVEAAHIGDLIRIGEETNLSPWSAASYLDEIKNPSAVLLRLISDDNTMLGFVVGRKIVGSEVEIEKEAEIYNIAVVKTKHRKGCGQKLFDAFCQICRDNDVTNIWLEVRESNTTAIYFYEKNGFKRVQTRPHFYSDPREHAILMKFVLK